MNLTKIRAESFGMLLLVTGLTNPSPANPQSMFSLEKERAEIPKAEQVPKRTSLAFKASELFLFSGTAFDMTTTVKGLDHPTSAYTSEGKFLTHYYVEETGWAGFLGRRDAFTAVGANVFKNVLMDRYSRRLYARGGRWRTLAFGMNILQGTLNSIAAGNNIRSDDRIDRKVRLATGYRGAIIWSH
jgi:hypothetical protein